MSVLEANESAQRGLVQRAQEGDTHAFAELVRLYQRRVVSVAYRLVGNDADAADVAQEAFVRAFRRLDQLDDPDRFGPWLMRVTTTQALNFRRGRGTRQAASLDEMAEATGVLRHPATRQPITGAYDDPDGLVPAELDGAISAALAELPDQQRLALILFSVEGLPQREVAEILECSVELVKWNVFQARKKLKGLLADYLG